MKEESTLRRVQLPVDCDVIAPDGSEIRLLTGVTGGSMCHCSLPQGATSSAVAHRRVEEIWYFISGEGQVWRKLKELEEVVKVRPGCSLNIPRGATFQFRNTGDQPLCFIIATVPPWPGEEEAILKAGYWNSP